MLVISLAAFIMLVCPAGAFISNTGEIWIFATTSCGQYAQDRKLPKGIGESAMDENYVAGWLTALNALMPGINIKGDARLDDTLLWLDRYCFDHPFTTMQDGLIEFSHAVTALPRQ